MAQILWLWFVLLFAFCSADSFLQAILQVIQCDLLLSTCSLHLTQVFCEVCRRRKLHLADHFCRQAIDTTNDDSHVLWKKIKLHTQLCQWVSYPFLLFWQLDPHPLSGCLAHLSVELHLPLERQQRTALKLMHWQKLLIPSEI